VMVFISTAPTSDPHTTTAFSELCAMELSPMVPAVEPAATSTPPWQPETLLRTMSPAAAPMQRATAGQDDPLAALSAMSPARALSCTQTPHWAQSPTVLVTMSPATVPAPRMYTPFPWH